MAVSRESPNRDIFLKQNIILLDIDEVNLVDLSIHQREKKIGFQCG